MINSFPPNDFIMLLTWALRLLEQQKAIMERKVRVLSPDALSYQSNTSTWTVLQILDHLRRVEAEFVREMAAARTSSGRVSPGERAKALLLIGLMLLPTRLKAPDGPKIDPDPVLNRESALADWSQARAALLKSVRELRATRFKGGVVRHPVSGWMGLTAATWFLAAHTIHHRYQLRRVRKSR